MQMKSFLAAGSLFLALASPAVAETPSYYPGDYSKLVEASKSESGVLAYSNIAEYNWEPILAEFAKEYPWIKVQTLELSSEIFERFYAERGSNARTADLLMTASIDNWQDFMAKGLADPYESPEIAHLPSWSVPMKGLYTASTDPMTIIYNKVLIPEEKLPKSVQDVASLVDDAAIQTDGKISTYNAAANTFGLSIFWAWTRERSNAWELFDKIGKASRLERSAGNMFDKVATGEYLVGMFPSSIAILGRMKDAATASIVGYSLPDDGVPVFLRGMALPKDAKNPASAKLLLDFLLSRKGQLAMAAGGLTPYRSDVKKEEVPYYTYDSIAAEVGGEKNIVLVNYDPEMLKQRQQFLDRWKQAFSAK